MFARWCTRESRQTPRRRARGERGSSLVEFAVVLPIFMFVVFGAIEFGISYNDYIAIRSGTREAARQGSVGDFGPTFTTGAPCHLTGATGSDNVKNLMCLAKSQIGLDPSKVRVKVLSGAQDFSASGTFQKEESLIVCAQVPLRPVTGLFSPFIGGKFLRTKSAIRIEKTDIVATGGQETAPTGGDWSWCTVSASSP